MPQNYARVASGLVVETFETDEDITKLFPAGYFQPCADGVKQGWTFADGAYSAPSAAAPAAPQPRFVPLATIRDRVTALGKWPQFAAALDALPSDKRWHLLTLVDGVAPDDVDAIALLTAVGCDPAAVLAAG